MQTQPTPQETSPGRAGGIAHLAPAEIDRMIRSAAARWQGLAHGPVAGHEDLIQHVWIKFLTHRGTLIERGTTAPKLHSWFQVVLRHRIFDLRRDGLRGRFEPVELDDLVGCERSGLDEAADGERRGRLAAHLRALPDVSRRIALLRYCEGLTWREVADRTGLSSGEAARVRHARDLQRLRGRVA